MDDLDDLIMMCDSDESSDEVSDGNAETSNNPEPTLISAKQPLPNPPSSTSARADVPFDVESFFDDDDDDALLNFDLAAVERQAAQRKQQVLQPTSLSSSSSSSTSSSSATSTTTTPSTANPQAHRAPPRTRPTAAQHKRATSYTSAQPRIATSSSSSQQSVHYPANHNITTAKQDKKFTPKPTKPIITSGVLEEFSGMRVKDRTIGSIDMRTHMKGRLMVKIQNIEKVNRSVLENPTKDWVTIGALYEKSMTRLSKNGKEYQIWTVGNLKGASLTIFMFDGAYNEHRLVPRASLLIFLNPKLLPSKNKTSIALSVTTAEQMIVLGTASNMGCCRSLKKDGRRCTNVINTQCSKYCDYHINSQYKKISRGRMDVAGSKTGKGMRSSRNNNNTRNSGSSTG